MLSHPCITAIYRYRRIYPDLVKKWLMKTSFSIQCPFKQNIVFRIKSENQKLVIKDFIFMRIFAPFTPVFTPGGTKTSYTLEQTWKFPLQVCLSIYVFLLLHGMKGLKTHSQA